MRLSTKLEKLLDECGWYEVLDGLYSIAEEEKKGAEKKVRNMYERLCSHLEEAKAIGAAVEDATEDDGDDEEDDADEDDADEEEDEEEEEPEEE